MKLQPFFEKCHQQAVEKGFWEGRNPDDPVMVSEALMLIVSEMGEAIEAHRKGRHTTAGLDISNNISLASILLDRSINEPEGNWLADFQTHVKDTVEDELADILIRIGDLFCGLGFHTEHDEAPWAMRDPVHFASRMWEINCSLVFTASLHMALISAFNKTLHLCRDMDVDIESHCHLKLAYNKTRPHKHGKAY